MGVNVSKIAASSYFMGLEQVGTTQNASVVTGGVVLAANGNTTLTLSLTAPQANCIGNGRIKFDSLTSPNPTDVGTVWYPLEGTFSLIVRGSGVSDFFWLEGYVSRSGTTYTLNFEIANNSSSVSVTVPTFTLRFSADFYAYPF